MIPNEKWHIIATDRLELNLGVRFLLKKGLKFYQLWDYELSLQDINMEYDKSIVNRLKRIEGKIKGVLNMIEQNKECRDVITSASRNANDRAIGLIASKNLEQCVR